MAGSAEAVHPFWVTVSLDFAQDVFNSGVAFWQAATGYDLSVIRGDSGEFASLVPRAGDDYLRAQRLGDGVTRLHLDLHVVDPWATAEAAERLGATLLDGDRPGRVVLRSPAGFEFCLVTDPAGVVPGSARWWSGHRSRVSRFCLDIPRKEFAAEVAFARELLGGGWHELSEPETALRPAGSWPVDLRLQPAEFASEVSAHLHLVTDDLATEVARLVTLGAIRRAVRTGKAILEAPGGAVVCVVALEAAAFS